MILRVNVCLMWLSVLLCQGYTVKMSLRLLLD